MNTKLKLISLIMLVAMLATPVAASQPNGAKNQVPLNQGAQLPNVPVGFLSGPQSGDALTIALNYINQNLARYGLSKADVADLIVTNRYTDRHNGVTHLYLRQRLNKIEIFGSNINISVTADGRVINLGDRFVRNLPGAANSRTPTRSVLKAVADAATHLKVTVSNPLRVKRAERDADLKTVVSDGGISQNDIPAKLMYYPTANGKLRLAWDMVIRMKQSPDWWNLRVDTETGEVVSKNNWTVDENGVEGRRQTVDKNTSTSYRLPSTSLEARSNTGTYQVYALPLQDPARGPRTIIRNPEDLMASPFGWHDGDGLKGADYTTTQGNNVFAYQDVNDSNFWDNGFPDGGAGLNFIFPINLHQDPHTYANASVTNLFYVNNVLHDIFYHYGFDEASGNFQLMNYSGEGAGEDMVLAQAQDGGGFTNANFATPPDGLSPTMQMYLGGPDPQGVVRDGSLDNHVVIHEYGHGISNRLIGGADNSGCLDGGEQGGEGWSDFFANVLVQRNGTEDPHGLGVGTWLGGQLPDEAGFRHYPYSTNMEINPSTYNYIKDTFGEPHDVGEVWTAMLWEMYWKLVQRHGFDPNFYTGSGGNNISLQLVMDGLKLTPCNPTFIDQRNAILMADLVDYPITPEPKVGYPQSEHECLLWESFAKRGLGYSANDGGSSGVEDGTEAFDLAPQCRAEGSFTLSASPPSTSICTANNEAAHYQAELFSFLDFNRPVTLTALGLPTGTTSSFNPNGIVPPYTADLTIGNTKQVVSGSYFITITGQAINHALMTATVALTAVSAMPAQVHLISPTNGLADVPILPMPTFAWADAAEAVSYTLEIATDKNFSQLVYTHQVATAWDMPPASRLRPESRYYWRVQAINPCGVGAYSEVYSLTMRAVAPILLVNDYNGAGAFAAKNATLGNSNSAAVVNLNNFDSGPYHTAALDELGQLYDVWYTGENGTDEPDSTVLARYPTVIWSGGASQGIDPDGEAALTTYLDGGGCLFVSGQDYLYAKGQPLTDFQQNYLGVIGVDDNAAHSTIKGAGDFEALGPYNLELPLGYPANWSDNLYITDTAQVAFYGDTFDHDGNPGIAAVSKTTNRYKTTFWAFSFETIQGAGNRAAAMFKVLQWCDSRVQANTISFNKTVAFTDTMPTALAQELIVPANTPVTYSYNFVNVGSLTYTHHTLVDSQFGTLLAAKPLILAPGQSYSITTKAIITQDMVATATWTALVTGTNKIVTRTSSTRVRIAPPNLEYGSCLDFETGVLPPQILPEVTTVGNVTGRVSVTSTFPYSGNYALLLDTAPPSGAATQQAAIIAVDLKGQPAAALSVWIRNLNSDNYSGDNISMSVDNGATYLALMSLYYEDKEYYQIQIDLGQTMSMYNITATNRLLLKFQAHSNYAADSAAGGGVEIDNLCLQAATPQLGSWLQGPDQAASGEIITYTTQLWNYSSMEAMSTTLTNPLPSGLVLSDPPTASMGMVTFSNNTVGWFGTVNITDGVAITYTAKVVAAPGLTITNILTINHASLSEPYTASMVTAIISDVAAIEGLQVDFGTGSYFQPSNQVVTHEIILSNTGLADLNWQVHEQDCTMPKDIPWASLSALSGTIAAGEMSDLILTTDSTGLDEGVFEASLCFKTDTPNSESKTDFAMTVDKGFTVGFTKTVGLKPNECAAGNTLAAPLGAPIYYCYQIENTSNLAYEAYTITDKILGVFTSSEVITPDTTMTMIVSSTATAATSARATADAVTTLEVQSGGNSGLLALTTAVHTITIANVPTAVQISGPVTGTVGLGYVFTATVAPPTTTLPIVYTWSPLPVTGQGSAVVSYTWAITGTQTITVVASNVGGSVTSTYTIRLNEERKKVYLPIVRK